MSVAYSMGVTAFGFAGGGALDLVQHPRRLARPGHPTSRRHLTGVAAFGGVGTARTAFA